MAAPRKTDDALTAVTAESAGENPLTELNHRLAEEAAAATTAEARTAAAAEREKASASSSSDT